MDPKINTASNDDVILCRSCIQRRLLVDPNEYKGISCTAVVILEDWQWRTLSSPHKSHLIPKEYPLPFLVHLIDMQRHLDRGLGQTLTKITHLMLGSRVIALNQAIPMLGLDIRLRCSGIGHLLAWYAVESRDL